MEVGNDLSTELHRVLAVTVNQRGVVDMLKKIAATLVVSTWLFSTPVSAGETVTVVADEWPPFSSEALPGKGISVDVITSVLTRAGYDVKSEILPWARIMEGARSGSYDIVGSLFYDADLDKFMTFGDAYFTTEIKFVQQAGGSIAFNDLTSLKPYQIAVGAGFLYEDKFDRAEDLNKLEVTTTLQGIQMVAFGRADLTLDSTHVVKHSIQAEDPGLAEKVEFLGNPLAVREIRMAVGDHLPNAQKIVDDFNRTLAEMKNDGSLASLLEKHNVN